MESADFAVLALALAFFGACVGSFLNVVVYRLPAGISLIRPGSRCPACGHAIRPWDNVPVLGWLWLAGRCRDCRTPIPVRYPLVEAATAGLFMLAGMLEIQGNSDVWSLDWVAQALFDLTMLCTLLAAALIVFDGKHLPPSLFLPAVAAGGLVSALTVDIAAIEFHALGGFVGLAVGLVVGRGVSSPALKAFVRWTLFLVGFYLGSTSAIQLALSIGTLSVVATQHRRQLLSILAFACAIAVYGFSKVGGAQQNLSHMQWRTLLVGFGLALVLGEVARRREVTLESDGQVTTPR